MWKAADREAGEEGKDASFMDATVWGQKQEEEAGGRVEHPRTEGAVPTSLPFFFFKILLLWTIFFLFILY